MFEWYRNLVRGKPVLGYSSTCPICTSIQVGIGIAAVYVFAPIIVYHFIVLAFSIPRLANLFHMLCDYIEINIITKKLQFDDPEY